MLSGTSESIPMKRHLLVTAPSSPMPTIGTGIIAWPFIADAMNPPAFSL